VTTVQLTDGSVTTPKLAEGAVTTPKLSDAAVTSIKVGSGSASAQMVLAADGVGGATWITPPPPSNLDPTSGTDVVTAINNAATLGTINVSRLDPLVAVKNAANTFTTGTQTVQTGADTTVGILVKGNSGSQSADLQQWKDSTNATVASVSPTGVLTGSGASLTNLDASNLASGTVADARLSSNVVLNNQANTFSTGLQTIQTANQALTLSGAPTNTATQSLMQIGNAIVGGNTTVNGGTYLGLNAPNVGAGSAADFLNFQLNGTSKFKIDNSGNITTAGTLTPSSLTLGSALFAGTGGVLSQDNANYFWDSTNHRLGLGTATPVDALSIGTAPTVSATRALVNLANTALVGGSANGTYVGANPAAFTGDFLNFQLTESSKFKIDSAGTINTDFSC
jgi:hypothetical protein